MRVLVTGAASGIGRATCLRLARDGVERKERACIAALDVSRDGRLDELVSDLEAVGASVITLGADLADSSAIEAAVGEAISAFDGLDGLVSNAGINHPSRLLELPIDAWDRLFAVNTRATWLLGKAAHAALKASNGSIVATASMSGSYPHANLGAYAPSKAALIMLVGVMAQEFGADGIRVNAVSPGMVRTGMTEQVYKNNEVATARGDLVPLGRVANPEDIADVIAFLLGPDARYINGHDLVVDGGVTGNHLGRLPGLTQITVG
ncbi:MAG: SDR family oxidoreductase [Pseudomonadota bacterium]